MIKLLLLLTLSAPAIVCPGSITRYNDGGQRYATITITPAVANDGSGPLPVTGVRGDSLLLTDPYPIGITAITWSATNADGTASCVQGIVVMQVGSSQRRRR